MIPYATPQNIRMSIRWSSELETGIRHIDLQHQELVDLINAAAEAHSNGKAQEMLEHLLPTLSAYVVFHFGMEETLMSGSAINADHVAAHRQAHREFTARVESLKQASAAGNDAALSELVIYLQQWLIDHIMKTDKELARQVRFSTGLSRS